MTNVFIIGSKGIPANYGGFETFVDKLVTYKKDDDIKYHVSCLSREKGDYEYNGARCFMVPVKNIGSARAVLYDIKALTACEKYIDDKKLHNCIIYILACRIGPFIAPFKARFEKKGIKLFVNPDGNEWKRSKWNKLIKAYWKYSEKLMVKQSDLLVCDSIGIEEYINKEYASFNPLTKFIAYGADTSKSKLEDNNTKLISWFSKNNVRPNEYYLIVGRFVPENNYETMIREFIKSETKKDLVIITNYEKNNFCERLLQSTSFDKDKRIKFVGTVYDDELLKKIREDAFAYLHGHEVGGTNPSLLEALASTKINILLDVNFNREVGQDGAVYFTKEYGDLAQKINTADCYSEQFINELMHRATGRIENYYSWNMIVKMYEDVFLGRCL